MAKNMEEPRCPYCVLGVGFRTMKILSTGRQICDNCGHIASPTDTAFRCPCKKCQAVDRSPFVRRWRREA
jgi:hypothetical protein